ncbi:OLC1v1001353C1 [Oldenlandia corymbosa var. corymbosa]|uniref:OLC1v1001353C1 n=1 Tax=Oldenlandia corymbosa var. corymbosa TaxID=529605 RepID=A0AAV1D6P2_OLDCO|nr:OLC1v1001353C1 [Oldenlandia corymbosa var. corymbosa]
MIFTLPQDFDGYFMRLPRVVHNYFKELIPSYLKIQTDVGEFILKLSVAENDDVIITGDKFIDFTLNVRITKGSRLHLEFFDGYVMYATSFGGHGFHKVMSHPFNPVGLKAIVTVQQWDLICGGLTTPQFHPEHESPVVPVWIAFEGLPIHHFNEDYLSRLASIVGSPLKIDIPTLNLSRPSIARVCVEVNLLQDLPKRVLLGTEEYSYYQEITYENLPEYCSECKKVGHGIKVCRRGKPKVTTKDPNIAQLKYAGEKLKTPINTAQATRQQKPKADQSDTEKLDTPIDVVDRNPLNPSSGKRKITKEKLATIMENSKEGAKSDTPWDVHDQNSKWQIEENGGKQLAVYVPLVNLSSRFAVLDNPSEEQLVEKINNDADEKEEQLEGIVDSAIDSDFDAGRFGSDTETNTENPIRTVNDGTQDDASIGLSSKETDFENDRFVVSDGEDHKKAKVGRPRGSIKKLQLHLSETRQSQPDRGSMDDFNSWINDCNLADLAPVGNLFTWTGTRQNGKVLKRLDHVLLNKEWMEFFQASSIHHLNRTTSDYAPLLHQFRADMDTRPSLFRFQKMWLRREHFLDVVTDSWNQEISKMGMLGFSLKLRRLKACRKDWNKFVFGNVFQNLKVAEDEGRRKVEFFQNLLEAFDAKISNWKNRFLTQGGKLVLIRHVLSALPLHTIATIEPPKIIVSELERKCQQFLWGENEDGNKRHWRAWTHLVAPIEENGLNIRSLGDVIKAFSLKLWWKVKNGTGIWAKFIGSLSKSSKERTSWLRTNKVLVKNVVSNISQMLSVHKIHAKNLEERKEVESLFQVKVLHPPKKTIKIVKWKPPDPSKYVLNTDGSALGQPGDAGWGYILRGQKGVFICAESKYIGSATSLEAELLGIYYGLRACIRKGLRFIEVQTDNQVITVCLQKGHSYPWKLYRHFRSIQSMLKQSQSKVLHIYREVNSVADDLAKQASARVSFHYNNYGELPASIRGKVHLDQSSFPYIRIK